MNKESISSYRKIADYIISYFQEHGEPLTNLKLQKLLYYAQGWYLALYNKPLFDDKIEAWVHGPVIPAAYHSFKQYGYGLIDEKPSFPNLSPKIRSHLDEVIDVYGSYSAFELEHLTHQTTPWKKARGNLPIDEASSAEISQIDMKEYFLEKVAENEQKNL
ncbi:Panacea domain-containing protein [Legionella jordanis]|uniref:Antitoxin SocA-like Panacea domain-containing protein n=1 Tax=Legionella jordanis TaxID=456 RepID=A0A0W0VCS7_9GAMM|nr:type II toxin-antitoxin system antitoxin SocA domain-containing protein [Legionella jordanis]KTD17941.1 hypothetical protein Ljor_2247 [Legionella jordanis]VEH13968.1 Uncharacterized phage-associated protein [Legionella jordanis]